MNNDKKTSSQTPTFKQNSNKKPFKAHSAKEKSNQNNPTEKRDKNRPHFTRKEDKNTGRQSERRNQKYNSRNHPKTEAQITVTTMDNISGTGKVNVMIKSSVASDKPNEKKTGPLSPRAPEKIKKNRAEEMKVYGEATCLTLFARRPDSIVRVWATVEVAHKIGEIFSYLATHKKVYHVVDQQELTLVSGTEHHNGICMLVKKIRPFTLSGYLEVARQTDCMVLLQDVQNAHNIGAIIRTCAFYGVKGVITTEPDSLSSAAAMRIAEGGMEYVHALQTDSTTDALTQLRHAGYQIIHTTINKKANGFNQVKLKNKVVFVLSESSSEHLVQENDSVVNLSFANPLLKNGLNIAVNTGVLLSGWYFKWNN